MAFQTIRYAIEHDVAYITLHRPEVLNAMNSRMHEELRMVWEDFESDPRSRVAVLAGAGDRSFSVGQDLTESKEGNRTTFGSFGHPGYPRLTERFDISKPIIAKVHGHVLGGGLELALACDIIVATTDATFGLPEARLGFVPGAGGVFRLTRQLPWHSAMGLLLTGRTLDAQRAFELGLINEVASREELDSCVAGWVDDILRCSPLAVRSIKEAATRSDGRTVESAFATRYRWEERRLRSTDPLEGPEAFSEGRAPGWQPPMPKENHRHLEHPEN
ncbi:enoyl-CoA hydratase-related protein [Nocardia brasiliensis]|uniref:enoyl-CoA hydratase-related protein n=1 Tax=Nocardia brasiliensis TaxID=37326 RepID=UPI002458BBF8|nr:enoyl-CoA hydratase-related protein [Nocardia brasiliensis]